MASVKIWFQAFRLRTLPLAFSSILLGTLLATSKGYFNTPVLSLSLLTTLFLQVLSNLANDYGDATSGIDGEDRKGPSRTVQLGLISKDSMKTGLVICAVLAFISGLILLLISFREAWTEIFVFLLIGLIAIVSAVKYTVGKNPYGYAGLGDLFVLIFFGWVGVMGTGFLFMKYLDLTFLLPATSCGLLAVGVLNVNNIRDIESDKANGKNSIPVRLGRQKAIIYHGFLLSLAVLSTIIFNLFFSTASEFRWMFLITLPLLVKNFLSVKVLVDPLKLDPYLKQLALSTFFYCILFGLGQLDFGL